MTDIKKSIFKHDPVGKMREEHKHFMQRKQEKQDKSKKVKSICKKYARLHSIDYKFTYYISGKKVLVKHHNLRYGEKVFSVKETGFSSNDMSDHYRDILWEKVFLDLLKNNLITDENFEI